MLPRDLPVVAQPEAADKCRKLGYTQIYELDHGQTVTMAGGKLTLTGTEGESLAPRCALHMARACWASFAQLRCAHCSARATAACQHNFR